MLEVLPAEVSIFEVGMRDGLQNQPDYLPAEAKIELINLLSETGLQKLEITSFVSPKWIPQLKDNLEVATGIKRKPGVVYSALVPNEKGLEDALTAGMEEIAVFLAVSETLNRKNINKTTDEALEAVNAVTSGAIAKGIRVRGYLSTVFGCPFEGEIDMGRVAELTQELLNTGAYEVSLGDTTGVGNPLQVRKALEYLRTKLDLNKIALHFHDTRGLGLANVLVGLDLGVTTYDSSFGGLGGCPYAKGASGNIATEDLVYLLHSMGIKTGVDLEKLMACSRRIEELMGTQLPSRYLRANAGCKTNG
ncbi:MAG: hydroxymethylglutaryl-CoA lyase [Clostridia bacterium]|nr:hydroxymethylglutaryl-CoA lyase [Clostridia bacterium]